jgi:uncharacterized RDD family membrane protein YckC
MVPAPAQNHRPPGPPAKALLVPLLVPFLAARILRRPRAMPIAPGWRRLAAFAVDYLVIAAYLGLLAGIALTLRRVTGLALDPPRTLRDRLVGEAISTTLLTLPVALYFALAESSPWRATLGKRVLGLRVSGPGGRRLSFGRSLLRSLLKLAPWEAAHAALWHTPGWPVHPEPGPATAVGSGLALLGAGWYALSLFVGDRRTPYDRAAGSGVVAARRDGEDARAYPGERRRGDLSPTSQR